MSELLKAGRLLCAVHMIEIFTFKEGPEHVYLHTNLPNPGGSGLLHLHMMCPRYIAADWVRTLFPGVETHVYDYASGRTNGQNLARPPILEAMVL